MPFGDAYTVRVHQTYSSIDMLNVFQVEKLEAGFTAQDVREAFIDTIVPLWKPLVNNIVTITTMDVLSLSDPEDFEVGFPVGQGGTNAGDATAALLAFSIRYNRTRRDVRHGYTRISGLNDDDHNQNAIVASYKLVIEDLADALVGTWAKLTPAANVCVLHVVKRVFVPATSEHRAYYRLPETSGEYVSYHPNTYFINPAVTSQASRKAF